MEQQVSICPSTEMGGLGVLHLKRLWSKSLLRAQGQEPKAAWAVEWQYDLLVMDDLGLGLHPTLEYLYTNRPTFEAFEAWILDIHGGHIEPATIDRVNAALRSAMADEAPEPTPPEASQVLNPILSPEDLAFWEENGYIIVPNAISKASCIATEQAIWEYLEMDAEVPDTWYGNPKLEGIMVSLYHHPALEANRRSQHIWRAFAQLYGTHQLRCSTDRVGLNPPERPDWMFPGPYLHWDTSLELPIPIRLQGILYISDTEAEQGAFTCVPGFHHRIADWLRSLPPDADPRAQDLYELGATPVAGNAGDLIIWHHALPHGSRPNRLSRPRLVQHITLYPIHWQDDRQWK